MDLQQLDIKNRCLIKLQQAGYHQVEDVVLMADDMLLEIFSQDRKMFLDFKECTYCYFCPYSYFRNRTCCDNVLHRGRFLSTSGIFYCEKMPGAYPVKNHIAADSCSTHLKHEQLSDIANITSNSSFPLRKEDICSLPPLRLFHLCCNIQENGTLSSSHPAFAVITLLMELQDRLTKEEFEHVLAVAQPHLFYLVTE